MIMTIFRLIALLILACGVSIANSAPQSSILTWLAPTTRTDGTSLDVSEIASYNIYRGSDASSLTILSSVAHNAADQSYVDENLSAGAYFYAVTTVDTDGNESAFSNIVSKIFLSAPSSVILTIQ